MDFEEPSSKRRRMGAFNSHLSQCTFCYTVPQWFMNNIQSAEDLKDTNVGIWLTNEGPSGIDDSETTIQQSSEKLSPKSTTEGYSHCFHVGQHTFDLLLDIVASLQTPDRTGRLSPSRSSVEICCNMRFGSSFLDELVVLIARELHSSLVSFNSQDMEDLALDFHYQELFQKLGNAGASDTNGSFYGYDLNTSINTAWNVEPDDDDHYDTSQVAKKASRCYFGDCDEHHASRQDDERANDAFLAIMNALRSKDRQPEAVIAAQNPMQSSSDKSVAKRPSPIILYFRDGLTSVTPTRQHPDWRPSPRIVMSNGGYKRDLSIQDIVRYYRRSGENIVMISATTHTDADEANLEPNVQIPWKISRCECRLCIYGNLPGRDDPKLGKITVPPLSVPTGWAPNRETQNLKSVTATRIQSFKRRLNAQLSDFISSPAGLLQPQCDWFSLFPQSVTEQFASLSFGMEVEIAFNRIISRCSRKAIIDLNDLRAILLQMDGNLTLNAAAEDDSYEGNSPQENESQENGSLDEESSGQGTQEEEQTEAQTDHPFHLVQSADDLDDNFDIETFDNAALARINTLIQLWRAENQAAPSSLATQAKSRSILLYGAYGTGKTLVAQAIARNNGFKIINVSKRHVRSGSTHITKDSIRAIFSSAKRNEPCIIFIDDIEILFHKTLSTWEDEVIKEFMHCLDAVRQERSSSFVLATTNGPWNVNANLSRRMHQIPMHLPDAQRRIHVINSFLKKENLAAIDVKNLETATEGFSIAELQDLCNQTTLFWTVQQGQVSGQESPVFTIPLTYEHFAEALKNVRSNASALYLECLEIYNRENGPTTRNTNQNDALAAFGPRIQEMIRSIASKGPKDSSDPFFWEKKFLSLIVDPTDMQTSWSDLAVSTKTEQGIKRLIKHHRDGGGSIASYGLLRRASTGGGALLYGPPGTGKTQLARALAHDNDMVAICATAADMHGKWHGDGPKAIKGLFNLGKLLEPSIIFIDEAEALFLKRDDLAHQHQMAELNQFLHEMDGLSSSQKGPFVLLATNLPGRLDSAVLRRVPNMFYLGLPSLTLRQKIFEIFLREEIVDPGVSTHLLAAKTSRFTGSDIKCLCVGVALFCDDFVLKDGEDKGKRLLTMKMFQEALQRLRPTATKAAISSIKAFAKETHPDGIKQMQAFEVEELEAQRIAALAEDAQVEKDEAPIEGSSASRNESCAPYSAPVLPSTPRLIPLPDNTQSTPTKEMLLLDETFALNTDTDVPAALYDPIPVGSNRIRVLSITPRDCQTSETLISCTLNQVDLEDWTAKYRSFSAMLPVFGEDLRLIENRILHIIWSAYNHDPDSVQEFFKDELHLFGARASLHFYCDHPTERFTNLHDRFSWGDYIALSYVWGDQTIKKKILINDKPFEVGLNLYDALERLSTSYEIRSRGLKVWIDAICINQQDVGEREIEVRKMGLIYSRALAVRGWLGHPSDEVAAELSELRLALDFATHTVEDQSSSKDWMTVGITESQKHGGRALSRITLDEDRMFSMWSAIDGLCGVPYWKRLWITQEIALASSILFWYGDCYVTPKELCVLSSWHAMNESLRNLDTYIPFDKLVTNSFNMSSLVDLIEWTREPRNGSLQEDEKHDIQLMKCISHAIYSQATDPRDKVYGLLALLPPTMSSRIRPNYSSNFTWRDAWIDFTKVFFQHQGNLNLLTRVDRIALPFRNGMPSWALNFEITESKEDMLESHADFWDLQDDTRRLLVHYNTVKVIFSAYNQELMRDCSSDAGFEPSFAFSMDDRLMSCTCIFVDHVSHVGNSPSKSLQMVAEEPYDTAVVQLSTAYVRPCPDAKLSLTRAMMGKKNYQWKDGPSIFDIPWISLEELERIPKIPHDLEVGPDLRLSHDEFGTANLRVAHDETERTRKIPWTQILSQEDLIRGLYNNVLHPNEHFPLRGAALRTYFTSEQDVCENWQEMRHSIHRSSRFLNANPICETRNGLVGWVTSLAQPGDSIGIIFGCDMPVVLRPRAGEYEVIGGCFIDGLMDGEVKEEVTSGRLVAEKIDLC